LLGAVLLRQILKKMAKIEFIQIDRAEFSEMVRGAVKEQLRELSQKPGQPTMVRGIRGLAAALGISTSKIQQLKNDGVLPYFQDGKLLLFDLDQVHQAMKAYNTK